MCCKREFFGGIITKICYKKKVIIIFFLFGISRSCACQSFSDDGTVRMSLLPVSIESVSSPALGSLHYANIHDGRQTRLPGSGICCFPTATRELDAMEWFIRFTGSTYPPTNHHNTPLQQQQQPPVVFVFTDGLSYLMISEVSFLSSLFYININWNKKK